MIGFLLGVIAVELYFIINILEEIRDENSRRTH